LKIVLLGATRGIGRAVARAFAERGEQIFVIGRDDEALTKTARDLETRGATGGVGQAHCDLNAPETFKTALEQADTALEGFDTVIVTAGILYSQEEMEADRAKTLALLNINFTHTILFCEEARERLMQRGGGTLCVFGSVAGDRGRKPIGIYGASKAGLAHYLESLDHRYRSEGLVTLNVKPGFIKTGMTEGLDPPPFAGEPEQVARDVVAAIDKQKALIYSPWIWRWVMAVIKRLPRAVMRRISF
jgi:decaprenylphospho-beta-D-erythro-pentofuranosid-2-ulose 2-reductase